MFQSKVAPVPQKPQKIARVLAPRDQEDLMHTRVHQSLDRVVHHGLVIDGKQVFVGNASERIQPAARTACKYHTFHLRSIQTNRAKCVCPGVRYTRKTHLVYFAKSAAYLAIEP